MTSTARRMSEPHHRPVLAEEALHALGVGPGGLWVDGTLGDGGHAERILEASAPDGTVVGIDRDEISLAAARVRLEPLVRGEPRRLRLVHASFDRVEEVLQDEGLSGVDGALLDLGLSSRQLDDPGRGFSFSGDGPLDMRMDRTGGRTAAELINTLDPGELARVLREYGEEKNARRIADQIVARRVKRQLTSTSELVDAVAAAFGGRTRSGKVHVATRTFQALRIAVNRELELLQAALPSFLASLKAGGRLVVIAFHSLEDRIVKQTFRDWETGCVCPPKLPRCVCGRKPLARPVVRKPITPSAREVSANPRSRSARLRAIEKIGGAS